MSCLRRTPKVLQARHAWAFYRVIPPNSKYDKCSPWIVRVIWVCSPTVLVVNGWDGLTNDLFVFKSHVGLRVSVPVKYRIKPAVVYGTFDSACWIIVATSWTGVAAVTYGAQHGQGVATSPCQISPSSTNMSITCNITNESAIYDDSYWTAHTKLGLWRMWITHW